MTLLEAFQEQIRLAGREDEPRPGMVVDRDGPVRRTWMHDPVGFATVECPAGLGEDPDHWIDRQVDFFRGRGQELEWKTYDDDEPADLLDRLRDRGFEIGEDEALVLGEVAGLVRPVTATGIHLRQVEVDDDAAFGDIEALMEVVWGRRDGHTARLREELRAAPEGLDVLVAELDGRVVSAAWVRYSPGTDFCSFWGGSTHPTPAVAGSTAHSARSGPAWPRRGASPSSGSTAPRTRCRSSPGWGSRGSRRPCRRRSRSPDSRVRRPPLGRSPAGPRQSGVRGRAA